jgi:hypothetical protein
MIGGTDIGLNKLNVNSLQENYCENFLIVDN